MGQFIRLAVSDEIKRQLDSICKRHHPDLQFGITASAVMSIGVLAVTKSGRISAPMIREAFSAFYQARAQQVLF